MAVCRRGRPKDSERAVQMINALGAPVMDALEPLPR